MENMQHIQGRNIISPSPNIPITIRSYPQPTSSFTPVGGFPTYHTTTHITTHTTTQHAHMTQRMMPATTQTCIAHTTQTIHQPTMTHPLTASLPLALPITTVVPSRSTSIAPTPSHIFTSNQHLEYHNFMHQQSLQVQAQAQAAAQWQAHMQLMQGTRSSPVVHAPTALAPPPASRHQYEQQLQQELWRQQLMYQQERVNQDQLQRILQQSMDQASLPNRAASAAAIERLKVDKVTEALIASQPSCTICLADFEVGEDCVAMPCKAAHSFHQPCLKTWLQIRNSCCVCRYELMTDDAEYNRTIRAEVKESEIPATAPPAASSSSASGSRRPSSSASPAASSASSSATSSRRPSTATITLLDDDDDESDGSSTSSSQSEMEDVDDGPAFMSDVSSSPRISPSESPVFGALSSSPAAIAEPLLQYQTLHHLQSIAAAEFSALAHQAQLHQQQQQNLIYYQQSLWQAQRNLQASLGMGPALPPPVSSSSSSSAPSTRSTIITPPIASYPSSILCSLCPSSDLTTLHSDSCVLSCGHAYHTSCWSAYLLRQQHHPRHRTADTTRISTSCPQCRQAEQQQRRQQRFIMQQQQQQQQQCPPLVQSVQTMQDTRMVQ